MMPRTLTVGTRGSALALTQTGSLAAVRQRNVKTVPSAGAASSTYAGEPSWWGWARNSTRQPLTAPATPSVKNRWRKKKRMTTGIAARITPAQNVPHCCAYLSLMKP